MNLLLFWTERISTCLKQAKNYEQVCACQALINNFKKRFTCQRGQIEAEALTTVFEIIRDRISEADKKLIPQVEIRYADE